MASTEQECGIYDVTSMESIDKEQVRTNFGVPASLSGRQTLPLFASPSRRRQRITSRTASKPGQSQLVLHSSVTNKRFQVVTATVRILKTLTRKTHSWIPEGSLQSAIRRPRTNSMTGHTPTMSLSISLSAQGYTTVQLYRLMTGYSRSLHTRWRIFQDPMDTVTRMKMRTFTSIRRIRTSKSRNKVGQANTT